jgi:hypothetical protein
MYIEVDAATHGILKHYADTTGVTLRAAATEAIQSWMEINGEPIIRTIEQKRAAKAARDGKVHVRVLAFEKKSK